MLVIGNKSKVIITTQQTIHNEGNYLLLNTERIFYFLKV